jgi:hypothetical protein
VSARAAKPRYERQVASDRREALIEAYATWQRPKFPDQATYDRYEQANPLFMSVDGLLRYWKRRAS